MSDATNPNAAPEATPPAVAAPIVAAPTPAPVAKPAEAPAAAAQPAAQPTPATPAEKPAANFWAKNQSLTSVAKMGAEAQAAVTRANEMQAELARKDAVLKSHAEQLVKDLPTQTMRDAVMAGSTDPEAIISRVNLLKSAGAVNQPVPAAPNTSTAPTAQPSPLNSEDPDISIAREVQRLQANKSFTAAGLLMNRDRNRYESGVKKLGVLNASKN